MNPVILLGAGRSGTKFLRDTLGVSSRVAVIPYDVGYIWRYKNESCPHDEFTLDMLSDSIKKYVREVLPRLIDRDDHFEPTVFIEKTVTNAVRASFVHAIYPEAKFIHLIRDGRAVSESAMRMWNAPPDRGYLLEKLRYFPWRNYRHAIWYVGNQIKGRLSSGRGQLTWGALYNGILEDAKTLPLEVVCARQWKKCIEITQQQLREVKPENVLEVRYEDLMQTSQSISKVCEFLDLEDVGKVIRRYESIVNIGNVEKWKDSLSATQLEMINNEIGPLNSSLGYLDIPIAL